MKTKIFISFILAATVAGCGGAAGGSGDDNKGNNSGDTNLAPVVSIFSAAKSVLEPNESVQLNILAFDPNNDAITCQLDSDGDGTVDQSFDDCQQDNSFNISFANAGSYNLSITATDGELSASKSLILIVNDAIGTPNNNPIITTFSQANSDLVYESQPFDLNILGSDADSDPLTCTLDIDNDGTADLTVADCETAKTASVTLNSVGSHTISLSITDGESTTSDTVNINVLALNGNIPPTILGFAIPSSATIYTGQAFSVVFSTEDTDSTELTCQLDSDGDGAYDQTISQCQGFHAIDNLSMASAGDYTLKLTVTDGEFLASKSLTLTVNEPNNRPTITTFGQADSGSVYDGQPFNLNILGSDADSDSLTCALDTNNDGTIDQIITDCETNKTVSVTLNGVRSHAIRLTINDGKNAVSDVINIDVLAPNGNIPPTILGFVLASTGTVYEGQTFSVLFRSEDTDSTELTCRLDSDGDGTYDQTINECQNLHAVNLSVTSTGDHTLWLEVTDGFTAVTKTLTVNAVASTSALPEVVSFKLLTPLPIRPNKPVEFEVVGRDTDSSISCSLGVNGEGWSDGPDSSCVTDGNIIRAGFYELGIYIPTLTITETNNLKRSTTMALPVTVVSNQSPVLNDVTVKNNTTIRPNQAVYFTWDVSDPENDALSCFIDKDNDGTQDNVSSDCDNAPISFSAAGTYTVRAKVIDSFGAESALRSAVVEVVDNTPAVINSFGFDKTRVRKNDAVTLTWDISDVDGDQLSCELDANGDGQYGNWDDGDRTLYKCANGVDSFDMTFAAEGEHHVNMKVWDSFSTVTATARLMVVANTAPQITEFRLNNIPVKVGENASFHIVATDIDADALSCAMDLDANGTFETNIGSCTTPIDFLVAASSAGVFDVALKVTDTYEGETTQSIKVAYYDHEITVDTQSDLVGVDVNNGICTTASGSCSLRAAVMIANHNHINNATPTIINLPTGTFTLSIPESGPDDNGLRGDLNVQGNIYVGGVSAEATIIDGDGAVMETRLFHVLPGASVTAFENITLQSGNGKDQAAGALYIAGGDLHLLNVNIQNNEATAAIAQINDGRVYVENSRFLNNTSTSGDGILWASDPIFVRNSEFSGNFSTGGAIYLNDAFKPDVWSHITATTFNNNASSDNGGAIYHRAGNLKIVDSAFIQNSATNKGGAIAQYGGNVEVSSTVFDSNTADFGGAVHSSDALNITNTLLIGNAATDNGGAVFFTNSDANEPLTLSYVTFIGNSAVGKGGAIYEGNTSVGAASVYLKGAILQANTTGTGSNCFGTINSSGYNLFESEESCVAVLNPLDSVAAVTLLEDTDATTGMATARLPFGDVRINSIPVTDCTNLNDEAVSIDQLGHVRPQGGGCEPGALEIVE